MATSILFDEKLSLILVARLERADAIFYFHGVSILNGTAVYNSNCILLCL